MSPKLQVIIRLKLFSLLQKSCIWNYFHNTRKTSNLNYFNCRIQDEIRDQIQFLMNKNKKNEKEETCLNGHL